MFFNSGVAGWTESYYTDQANPQTAALTAFSLAKFRMRLCGEGINLPYIRISDIDVRGDAVIDPSPPLTTTSNPIPPGYALVKAAEPSPADVAWTAVIVALTINNQAVGRIFMRGVNDEFFLNDKIFRPLPSWQTAFIAFQKELHNAANGWGVTRRPKSTPLNTFKIGAAQAVLGTNLRLIVAPGFAAAPGNTVTIRGLKSNQGTLTGPFTVAGFTAPQLDVFKQFPDPQPIFTGNTGTVQVTGPVFIQQLLAQYRGATTRHAGRPFGAPVGRRKKAIKLR